MYCNRNAYACTQNYKYKNVRGISIHYNLQLEYPSAVKWMNELSYIHTMEYYVTLRMNSYMQSRGMSTECKETRHKRICTI